MSTRARGDRRAMAHASSRAMRSSSLGGGGRRPRSVHERGTRRARACIVWATLLLLALSLTPRAWYARYIDVFGERGEQSIGERIEARIRARETEREAARLAAMRERRGAARFWEWLGTSRRDDDTGWRGGSERVDARERGGVSVDGGERGVDGNVASGRDGGDDGERRRELGEREQSVLRALKERLVKINQERDSIIYLVRKIQGESLDSADGDFRELTENEIEELSEKMALRSESKSFLKTIIRG